MLADAAEMKISTLDVIQEFTQSSRVAVADQLLIRVHWYGIVPWGGNLRTVKPKDGVKEEYYYLAHRPLYGLKDSPLRWYLHYVRHCDPGRIGSAAQTSAYFLEMETMSRAPGLSPTSMISS